MLANGARTVDLLISDVVMPIMDGPTMVREARKTRPELPILFMSGYAEEQLRKSIDIDNVAFPAQALLDAGACRGGAGRPGGVSNELALSTAETHAIPEIHGRHALYPDRRRRAAHLDDARGLPRCRSVIRSRQSARRVRTRCVRSRHQGWLRSRHPRRESEGRERLAGREPTARAAAFRSFLRVAAMSIRRRASSPACR